MLFKRRRKWQERRTIPIYSDFQDFTSFVKLSYHIDVFISREDMWCEVASADVRINDTAALVAPISLQTRRGIDSHLVFRSVFTPAMIMVLFARTPKY